MDLGEVKPGPVKRLLRTVEGLTYGLSQRYSRWQRLGITLVICSLVQLILVQFGWEMTTAPYMLPLALVILIGWFLGPLAGELAVFLAGAGHVYFFVRPYLTLDIRQISQSAQTRLWSYLAVATAVNVMFGLLRYARSQSELRGRRLKTLIDGSGEALMLTDVKGSILFINQTAEKLLGKTVEQIYKQKLLEMVHPADYDKMSTRLTELTENSQNQLGLSVRIKHQNGSWRWIEMNGTNLLDNSAIKALVMTFHDITIRKLAELELQASEERLALAQSAAHIGTFDWNIMTGEVAWSAEMERIYGLRVGEFEGTMQHWMKQIDQADRTRLQAALDKSIETGEALQIDYQVTSPSGETRWMAAKGTVVADKTGQPARIIGVNSDFTDRKRGEETQSFMVQASKLLASSMDYENNLAEVSKLAVKTVVDWCVISLVDENGSIYTQSLAHRDSSKSGLAKTMYEEYPSDREGSALKQVVEEGKTVFLPEVSVAMMQASAADERHLELIKQVGFSSVIIVPIQARGRSIGAVSWVLAESNRKFRRTDVGVAHSLAERAAAAIDNARLYRQTRAANVELEQRVTERTEDLRRSEEQYRLMFESLQDVYYRTDSEGRVILISPSVEKSWGFKPEEIIGRHASEFFADPVVERSRFVKQIEKHGEVTDFEIRLKGKEDRVMHVSITAHAYKDWSGKVQGVEGIIRDITERRTAEQQLHREQKFIRELIHSSKDGMMALDKNLHYTVWNPGMEAITGLTAHEVLGKSMNEVFPETTQDGVVPHYIKPALEGHAGETGTIHYEIQRTGRQGFMDSRYSPIYDEGGEVIGVLGVVRDVTERHLAEEEVKKSQAALKQAQAMASIGSWEWDIEKNKISWSEELCRLFEVDQDKFDDDYQQYLKRLPADDRARIDALISQARKGGGNFNFEHRIQRKDGSQRIIYATGEALANDDGQVVGMRGTSQDITDRKLAEEILRESEERFRLIVDGVKDYAIFMLDPGGLIASWNSGAKHITGYETHEILGKHFSIFYPPEEIKAGKPAHELEVAAKDGKYQEEGWRIRKDGSVYMANVLITALFNSDGALRGFSKVSRDVTEQKKIEQMKGDFVSLVSHQLKTPAALVRGYVDNLLSGLTGDLNAKQIEYLKDIQDISTKNYNLIADLLNISRIERGVISMDVRPVKLRDIMHLALRSHQPRFTSKGIKLNTRYGDPEVMVLADKFKTAEAISNIVDNALKFTQEGGIAIQASAKAGYLEITVADTGAGISPELMGKLFTRDQIFSGSPRPEGGSGLGLYIAKQFMQVQGGDITVESEVGRGTKFTFSLPLAKVKKNKQETKIANER